MTKADIPAVLALDAQHFGTDRAWLLRRMLSRSPGWVIEAGGRIAAAVLGRDGTRWRQAGPLWAETAPQARRSWPPPCPMAASPICATARPCCPGWRRNSPPPCAPSPAWCWVNHCRR